jgi:hypothetical protein
VLLKFIRLTPSNLQQLKLINSCENLKNVSSALLSDSCAGLGPENSVCPSVRVELLEAIMSVSSARGNDFETGAH